MIPLFFPEKIPEKIVLNSFLLISKILHMSFSILLHTSFLLVSSI